MNPSKAYDAVIVGGGHNGLVAAAYLSKAGLSVLLLERRDHLGGASVSAAAFDGVDARLSRYSYLVSLLPRQIIADLDLDLQLIRRRYSSYTPVPGGTQGLLVDNHDDDATAASFAAIGAASDGPAFDEFYARTGHLAEALWPTMTEPLLRRSEAKQLVGDDAIWADFIERPLGEVIERSVTNDLVRGVMFTDGLISTYARAHEPTLQQNKCFLYHVIGGGTGDWDVPVGGMGAVSAALQNAARNAGAELRTSAEVTSISPDGDVRYRRDGQECSVSGGRVLVNAAPAILRRLLGTDGTASGVDAAPEGSQLKVNLLLSRLPRLKDPALKPEAAFGGTFHINELYTQLETAYQRSSAGRVPVPMPAEIYCHSLADPSILSPQLRAAGAHTLTIFTLNTPHRLLTETNNDRMRDELTAATMASLNSVLAEPIEDCLLVDAHGQPCIEAKTTLDLEHGLNMPGGSIFHGPLSWPFAEDDRSARLAGAALGRGHRTREDPALRSRFTARRRGQRARRP